MKFRNLFLFLSSLLFYVFGEQALVLIMLFSVLADYVCGLLIEKGRRRTGLILSIVINISLLGFFKYSNFAFDNLKYLLDWLGVHMTYSLPSITLPIGISFYTFQSMSYTIDVYKGSTRANRSFVDFGAFVTMFPQLVAGPIVRYVDVQKQLASKRVFNFDKFSEGIHRFIIGLAKKVLIANSFALLADDVFAQDVANLSTLTAWAGIIAYSFQIYYDFSGYSDMAIGLGKMFGFDFLENFNYPYISKNIREFWRRWHISLSSWFRDYLYLPLGGSHHGTIRTYVNLFIVFFVTGLWHGASWNFVVWGLFHGSFMVVERLGLDVLIKRFWLPLQHIYTLLVVVIGWVFFRTENIGDALLYIQKMFGIGTGSVAFDSYISYFYGNIRIIVLVVIASVFSMPVYHNFIKWVEKKGRLGTVIYVLPALFLLLASLVYLLSGLYNPFIYYKF
jgi:alginate O-acetyltransferase complex protein AlgI